ncbi:MAG: extracellular solute-binding protein [Anaerolineae bacterium]|nr:extracellular solute-binding protein [Anaerolineae bacterium]
MNNRKLSRRDFLKTTGAAAALAVAPKFYAPPMLNRRRQNTVVLKIQSFAHDAIKAVLPEFEEATGLTVELESGVSSGVEHLTEVSTAYAAGDSPWDVVSDSDESAPVLARAGWLAPLDDVIPQETWDDFPQGMKDALPLFYGYDGALCRVPHEFAVGYFFYRKDLIGEPPTTWEEVISMGKELSDPDNGVWATTDAISRGALMYVYLAYLTSQTGGDIFAMDEGTAEATQFLYDMIETHQIFPKDAINMNYDQQNELYMDDRVMFMRQWPFFQSVAEGDTEWYAPEKVAIGLPPAGPAGTGSWWGGWGFTVPALAPNMDGAKELIKFLTSNEVAPKLAEGQSWFIMPRASILEAFKDKGNPIVDAMGLYAEENVIKPRPFHPRLAEAQTAVEDALSLFITGQATLEEALETGKELLAELEE